MTIYSIPGEDDPSTQAVLESEGAEALLELFAGEGPSDAQELAQAIKESFGKDVADLGKRLFADHDGEKQWRGTHVFHGFERAMQEAFPGWPDDLTAANSFASGVFFGGGKMTVGPWAKQESESAFRRFANVLWPGQKVPDGRRIALMKILAKGVKYCSTDYIDKKYKVELGPVITRRGAVFDSQALFDQKIGGRYLSGSVAGAKDWTKSRSIWVMTWSEGHDPVFYTHVGKLGRFHHSSFKAGAAVTAAGEWVINNGKLAMINACSGHYRPEAWRFAIACNHLKNAGTISDQTKLEMWDAAGRQLVPCLEFLKNLSVKLAGGCQLYPRS